jgi:NitT/TauT family transport system substrate-binding protein
MTIKRVIFILLTVLTFGSLTALDGCRGQTTALKPVVIGLAPSMTSALDIIAETQGFFLQEGIKATIRQYPSGKLAMDDLLAGKIDLASSALFPVVTNSMKRNDFQVLTTVASSANDNEIVARRDAGIKTIADLKGKRVGTMQGTTTQYVLDLLLMQHHLASRDVVLSFGSPDELAARLAAKELDAVCVLGAAVGKAQQALGANAVVFRDENLVRITTCVTALKSAIQKAPDLISRFLKAYILAEKYILNNPEEALRIVTDRFQIDSAVARRHWKPYMFKIVLNQSLILDMENLARWQMQSGLINSTKIPAYLDFIYFKALEDIDADRVSIIH